ncbi:serine/threonine-protein kinase [Gordonia hydrophobica]|uniref:non-specific serine/threonine protein kinase n=1 Tax=Gordonia hydrophobica TaxID=40516 RepID=A0ABZ2U652_9ACTN|nr:serine/threonine-protein kinase [Gordonia hydrophobica]MBM7367957.1 serine/threonine-protein kinase [Gordonia hydrophobica]
MDDDQEKESETLLQSGDEFAGYTIIRQLGRGGMGEVYLARHPRLPRSVALKVLRPVHHQDREFRRRFAREADLAASLDHRGIVAVYDRGEQSGLLWMSMQYVDGPDAARLLREHGALAPAVVAGLIRDVAAALDYAHRHHVIHRDVKPANILVRSAPTGPEALIADFGIAVPTVDATRITLIDSLVGSVEYAAPERLTDSGVDSRADQYSLGCTAFQLLTGELPFYRPTLAESVIAHLSAPMPSVCALVPGLDPSVDRVLNRALSKNREDRYPTCREFADDLLRAVGVGPQTSRRAPSRPVGPAQPAPAAPRTPAAPPTPPQSTHVPGPVGHRMTVIDASLGEIPADERPAPPPDSAGPVVLRSAIIGMAAILLLLTIIVLVT